MEISTETTSAVRHHASRDVGSTVRFYAYNDLVSCDHQDELMRLRDAATMIYFRVGDIANEEIMNNAHRDGITQQAIFDAVGVFFGKSGRTVRYYAETAAKFDHDVRKEFDMLPFSHFDLARNYDKRWREVLEYAQSHISMSAEQIKTIFDLDVRNSACNFDVHLAAYEECGGVHPVDENENLAVPLFNAQVAPVMRRTTFAPVVGRLVDIVSQSKRLLSECSSISPELKTEVMGHVDALAKLLPRVLGELGHVSDK